MTHADSAAAYERYISENWDSLPPFEQEQARAYLQSRFQAMQPQLPHGGTAMSPQPGYPSAGAPYGYGMYGGFAPVKKEQEGGWAVPVGYIGLLFFTPLAVFCGIYNLTKGRTGHGLAQILIPIAILFFLFMALAAGP